jgi:hypothetical protein
MVESSAPYAESSRLELIVTWRKGADMTGADATHVARVVILVTESLFWREFLISFWTTVNAQVQKQHSLQGKNFVNCSQKQLWSQDDFLAWQEAPVIQAPLPPQSCPARLMHQKSKSQCKCGSGVSLPGMDVVCGVCNVAVPESEPARQFFSIKALAEVVQDWQAMMRSACLLAVHSANGWPHTVVYGSSAVTAYMQGGLRLPLASDLDMLVCLPTLHQFEQHVTTVALTIPHLFQAFQAEGRGEGGGLQLPAGADRIFIKTKATPAVVVSSLMCNRFVIADFTWAPALNMAGYVPGTAFPVVRQVDVVAPAGGTAFRFQIFSLPAVGHTLAATLTGGPYLWGADAPDLAGNAGRIVRKDLGRLVALCSHLQHRGLSCDPYSFPDLFPAPWSLSKHDYVDCPLAVDVFFRMGSVKTALERRAVLQAWLKSQLKVNGFGPGDDASVLTLCTVVGSVRVEDAATTTATLAVSAHIPRTLSTGGSPTSLAQARLRSELAKTKLAMNRVTGSLNKGVASLKAKLASARSGLVSARRDIVGMTEAFRLELDRAVAAVVLKLADVASATMNSSTSACLQAAVSHKGVHPDVLQAAKLACTRAAKLQSQLEHSERALQSLRRLCFSVKEACPMSNLPFARLATDLCGETYSTVCVAVGLPSEYDMGLETGADVRGVLRLLRPCQCSDCRKACKGSRSRSGNRGISAEKDTSLHAEDDAGLDDGSHTGSDTSSGSSSGSSCGSSCGSRSGSSRGSRSGSRGGGSCGSSSGGSGPDDDGATAAWRSCDCVWDCQCDWGPLRDIKASVGDGVARHPHRHKRRVKSTRLFDSRCMLESTSATDIVLSVLTAYLHSNPKELHCTCRQPEDRCRCSATYVAICADDGDGLSLTVERQRQEGGRLRQASELALARTLVAVVTYPLEMAFSNVLNSVLSLQDHAGVVLGTLEALRPLVNDVASHAHVAFKGVAPLAE